MPFSGRCGPLLLTRIVFFSHSCYTERDSLCGREENILIERLCRWSVPAFLLLEGALYLFFLALDLLSPGPLSTALKYAALLLCLLQRTSRICLTLCLCICDNLLCLCICLCYDLLCAAVCLLDQLRCIFIQRAFYQLRIRLSVRLCCSRLIIFRFIHVDLFFLHDLIRIRRHFPKGFQPL